MNEDVYDPLERYQTEFQEKFARLTRELFARLVAASGVDETANANTIAAIARLEAQLSQTQAGHRFWQNLTFVTVLALILCAALAGFAVLEWLGQTGELLSPPIIIRFFTGLAGVVATAVVWRKLLAPKCRQAAAAAQTLSEQIKPLKELAWEQMAPLNQLYDWDMPANIIAQTLPKIQFDPYFTAQRLHELQHDFGLDDSDEEDLSVIAAQSGTIHGNPFVFAHLRTMQWGEKTYTGRKNISWIERVKGPDGKYRSVQRHETLVATVCKPIPVYDTEKILFYGHDAAPELTFSRSPSSLSGGDGGFFHSLRKKQALEKLKDFSRNLEDESQFTLMGNHDFELLFHATDRNDEIKFRLLFTPLAQQQMLKLLQDSTIGYGDDFTFAKQGKLNLIAPQHLKSIPINTNPTRFAHYDLNQARILFQQIHEDYFKALYFTLAPLLAIPLYQQNRLAHDADNTPGNPQASSWEHEALAHYHGEAYFQHPECITRNILKTRVTSQTDGVTTVAVTALGYQGITRTECQNIRGGDGRIHQVSVEWTEFLPVQQTKPMLVAELPGLTLQDYQRQSPATSEKWRRLLSRSSWQSPQFRRSLLSFRT